MSHPYVFLCSNKVDSTFHHLASQTIRWFRRSDRKPSRLPFRLKELRTFACFPVFQQRGRNDGYMICLFSSSLACSILASVFSAQTANEVCGLYPFSPERETFGKLSFSLLWHSYVLAIQLILYSLNFVAGHTLISC